jgi:hypothetical protein
MKTIFNEPIRAEVINRINSLTNENTAQWGKMNLYQMLRHCTKWNDWILGTQPHVYKQEFLGLIFGKMALKGMVKDDSPMKKNMPAGAFKIKEQAGDTQALKKIWASQIADYANFSNTAFIHDFFGKMTKEEIGILAYKHFDHHLRQFGR